MAYCVVVNGLWRHFVSYLDPNTNGCTLTTLKERLIDQSRLYTFLHSLRSPLVTGPETRLKVKDLRNGNPDYKPRHVAIYKDKMNTLHP